MTGTVVEINTARGMVGVRTEDGTYSVFELLGGDAIEIADVVRWSGDTPLGGERLLNVTQGSSFEVYFQNHRVSKEHLRRQLLFGQ